MATKYVPTGYAYLPPMVLKWVTVLGLIGITGITGITGISGIIRMGDRPLTLSVRNK
jgi:hypothetical protein